MEIPTKNRSKVFHIGKVSHSAMASVNRKVAARDTAEPARKQGSALSSPVSLSFWLRAMPYRAYTWLQCEPGTLAARPGLRYNGFRGASHERISIHGCVRRGRRGAFWALPGRLQGCYAEGKPKRSPRQSSARPFAPTSLTPAHDEPISTEIQFSEADFARHYESSFLI